MATKLSRTACPIEATLSLISDKWKTSILRDLLTGTKRFGELKKSIGSISRKSPHVQSSRHGRRPPRRAPGICRSSAARRIHADQQGELTPVIDAMRIWGEEHQAELVARRGGEIPRFLDQYGKDRGEVEKARAVLAAKKGTIPMPRLGRADKQPSRPVRQEKANLALRSS